MAKHSAKKKTKVISIANSKGGSGKSTTASMLSIALGQLGYKVLAIDCDSQMDLTNTMGFTVDETLTEFGLQLIDFNKTIYQAMKNKDDLSNYITPTRYDNVDIVSGDDYISKIEYELHHEFQREFLLKKISTDLIAKNEYDFIILDTSTYLGDLSANILNVCDYVIIPVPMAMFGIRGIRTFLDFFNQFSVMNEKLEVLGILTTLYKPSNKIMNTRGQGLIENVFGKDMLFRTKINLDTSVEKAQWNSIAVLEFSPKSKAAMQYMDFAKEVVKRVNQKH